MKQLTLHITCLLLAVALKAAPGPQPASANSTAVAASAKKINAGAIKFRFLNTEETEQKDSVLIIFDRFDHTGAGVIYKVFAENQDNSVDIDEVPAGKYFVTIQCLGLHHDRLEKTVVIKSGKNQNMKIELETSEIFSKDKVVIPAYHTTLTSMTILKSK